MLVGFVLCSVGPVDAATHRFGDISISYEPQPTKEGTTDYEWTVGYCELRFLLTNHSDSVAHTVRLAYPRSNDRGMGLELLRNSRTVQIPPSSSMTVSLFQPALDVHDERMAVEIDGRQMEISVPVPLPFERGYSGRYKTTNELAVLTSRNIPESFRDDTRTSNSDAVVFFRSELDVNQWSPNWLGYTVYQAVLMTQKELDSLPADIQRALRRYVEVGGRLLVYHETDDAELTVPADMKGTRGFDGAEELGLGVIVKSPRSGKWPESFWNVWTTENAAMAENHSGADAQRHVPVRSLLALVIGFAILIGPVNIWILARRQKRMWLWWNVPLISFLTCLTVFAYSLLAEGVHTRSSQAVLTVLDESTHHAASLGSVYYYTPLSLPDGLRFSPDTEVSDPEQLDNFWRRTGRAKSLDWTKDQHLTSGWVSPRIPANYAIRKSEIRRERLAIRKGDDGTVTVVNGLGADLESVLVRSSDGSFWEGSNIPGGAEQKLTRKSDVKEVPETPEPRRTLLARGLRYACQELRENPQRYLRPGEYVAVMKESPFLEQTVNGARDVGSLGIVFGLGAGDGHGN